MDESALVPAESDMAQTAASLLPYLISDSRKAKYLSLRVCGFAVREACKYAKVSESAVRHWRKTDPTFHRLEVESLPQLRKEFAAEALGLYWVRNYRLILEKDGELLAKSLNTDDEAEELTSQEWMYLRKIRGQYTPDQLMAIYRATNPEGPQITSFKDLVITLRQEKVRQEMVITGETQTET